MDVNGGLVEDQDVSLPSTADQEVPHPDVLPDQSSRDFDFNEFFNLEKTMPGLASVSTEDVVILISLLIHRGAQTSERVKLLYQDCISFLISFFELTAAAV